MEKHIEYAIKIREKVLELFEDEYDNSIDINELNDEENLKSFFHALSTVVPCDTFNQMVGDNKHHLEYNQLANSLCFEFSKREEP